MKSENLKRSIRMEFIYNALESGWTVRKKNNNNSFEFLKTSWNNQQQKQTFRRCASAPLTLTTL